MQRVLDNTFIESSADHQDAPHIGALMAFELKKHSHRRSDSCDSLVAIAPMDDSSSTSFSELETSTTEEPSMPESDELVEYGDTAHLNPPSDAQRLAAQVRSKMITDEPLQGDLSSYSEDSRDGHGQSPPPSPPGSPDLSKYPSDLMYIDSIPAQDEALEIEATDGLRQRPTLRSRMKILGILFWLKVPVKRPED